MNRTIFDDLSDGVNLNILIDKLKETRNQGFDWARIEHQPLGCETATALVCGLQKEGNIKEIMRFAYELAKTSPDPSTQNSAVLVVRTGDTVESKNIVAWDINRFPHNVRYTDDRWERPLKYKIIEHAERNVIYKCAKEGISTKGLVMVAPWAACSDCARAIIQAGITELITDKRAFDKSPDFWKEEIDVAHMMMIEAGVKISWFDEEIGGIEILHSGEVWKP